MSHSDLLYQIALTLLPNVGSVHAKSLVAYCGGVKEVFEASHAKLTKAPGVGPVRAKGILDSEILDRAEEELKFLEKEQIRTYFYTDADYPKRLAHCYDNPVLLYSKGETDLNASKILSIVGTRRLTEYGRAFTQQLVAALGHLDVLIVSGLAYGIDITAHKAALDNGLQTVAVLGHGLDVIYPAHHKSIAAKMTKQGALLSEFHSKSKVVEKNFPQRNRVVAGIADATVVVETKLKGGSMITAELANSYDKDVFAVPGDVSRETSAGCNFLIKTYRAHLLDSPEELIEALGWSEQQKPAANVQKELFEELNAEEEIVVNAIKSQPEIAIDDLTATVAMPASKLATTILNLELKGIVHTLPGKRYRLS